MIAELRGRPSNYRSHESAVESVSPSLTGLPATARLLAPVMGDWRWPGESVEVRVLFSDPDRTAAPLDVWGNTIVAPSSVVVVATDPNGNDQTPGTMSQNSDGSYSGLIPVDLPGTWWFQVAGSGSYSGVIQAFVQVRQSRA